MKDRIAIVTGGLGFGGSTSFVLQLASGLQEIHVPSAVFSFMRKNEFAGEFEAKGIPVHTTDEERLIFEDRLAFLCKKIAEFAPTAVLANIGAESYELLRYVPQGVARIGIVHDLATRPQLTVRLYHDVLDGVAAVNPHLASMVHAESPQTACRYVTHGIPLVSGSRPRDPNPDRPLKLIFFGRLEPGKGTRVFPLILRELQKRNIPFQWTIHGQGSDESYLRETLKKEIEAGQVVMSSQVPREKLFAIVRQHDVFIMASDIEGGPLTLLEAMSAGLVPVCNNIPSLAQEVVKPENGFLIPRDPARYAECLAILHQDRALLEKMSAAAKEIITANFTLEAMARRYLDFIHSLTLPENAKPWPRHMDPKPIRTSTGVAKIAQSVKMVRHARRVLKRIRS
ncbi:MAG TPA: glycosyltransferase family 4 protein [Candidatus Angelobacter sp.]|nr:glycosyltransferase family 4 protein [Candidatus Angelobacter sp.]